MARQENEIMRLDEYYYKPPERPTCTFETELNWRVTICRGGWRMELEESIKRGLGFIFKQYLRETFLHLTPDLDSNIFPN